MTRKTTFHYVLRPSLKELLSETGRFYLVAIQQNRPQDIISRMSRLGLRGQVSMSFHADACLFALLRMRLSFFVARAVLHTVSV